MEIGSVGWRHAGWQDAFYPASMPEEWALTYYSNEFPCVLVPLADLVDAQPEQWFADTHEQFRFFLQTGEDTAGAIEALRGAIERLHDRVGGVIWSGVAAPGAALAALMGRHHVPLFVDAPRGAHEGPQAEGPNPVWAPASAVQGCTVGLVRQAFHGDRRAVRNCVEAFARQAPPATTTTLFFAGDPPELHSMRDATVIAGLLGV